MEARTGNVIINVDRKLNESDIALISMMADTLSSIIEGNLSDVGVDLMFLLNKTLYKNIMPILLLEEMEEYNSTIKKMTEFFKKEVERRKNELGGKTNKKDKEDE